MFDRGDPRQGAGVTVVLRRAAVENAALVQVDVGFDQAGACEMTFGIEHRGIGHQVGFDRDDLAGPDTDIDRGVFRGAEQARVADNQVHAVTFRRPGGPCQPGTADAKD